MGLELFAPPPTHTTIAHELLAHWQPMKPESIIIMISEPGRAGKKKLSQSNFETVGLCPGRGACVLVVYF